MEASQHVPVTGEVTKATDQLPDSELKTGLLFVLLPVQFFTITCWFSVDVVTLY